MEAPTLLGDLRTLAYSFWSGLLANLVFFLPSSKPKVQTRTWLVHGSPVGPPAGHRLRLPNPLDRQTIRACHVQVPSWW